MCRRTGQQTPSLGFGDRRVQAPLGTLPAFRLLPQGFNQRQLRERRAAAGQDGREFVIRADDLQRYRYGRSRRGRCSCSSPRRVHPRGTASSKADRLDRTARTASTFSTLSAGASGKSFSRWSPFPKILSRYPSFSSHLFSNNLDKSPLDSSSGSEAWITGISPLIWFRAYSIFSVFDSTIVAPSIVDSPLESRLPISWSSACRRALGLG